MSIFERFNCDKAESTIAQVVVGSMIIGAGFLGINAPGLINMFGIDYPVSNQYVQEPVEETPVDNTDEPMDDNEDSTNADDSDSEETTESPTDDVAEESSADLLSISDVVSCDGDMFPQGVGNFSVSFDALLPAGTTITMPSWVYNNPGSYTQDSGIEKLEDNGTDVVFKVIDEGDGFGYANYYFSTSKEYVSTDFKESVKIVLPDGFEADSESVLEYDLNVDSPYCSIESY